MPAVFIDQTTNADWPKRTDDTLEGIAAKGDALAREASARLAAEREYARSSEEGHEGEFASDGDGGGGGTKTAERPSDPRPSGEPSAEAITRASTRSSNQIRDSVRSNFLDNSDFENQVRETDDGRLEFLDTATGEVVGSMTWDELETDVVSSIANSTGGTVSIFVDDEVLLEVLDDGEFYNQYESGSSSGYYNPDSRMEFEREHFGVEGDVGAHPIYGTTGWNEQDSEAVNYYGNAVVDLKDSVGERSTVTLGDSLDGDLVPIPHGDDAPDPDRALAAAGASFVDEVAKVAFADLLPDADPMDVWGEATPNWQASSYPEAQIYGGVSVDDIAHVTFQSGGNEPGEPAAEVTAALDARGISWSVL